MDHGNSYKGKHSIGLSAYSFRGSVDYHGRKYGVMQVAMVLEKVVKSPTSCRQQEAD